MIKENTKAIYLESPGTYTFEVIDIIKVMEICKKYDLKSLIDNTWATAIYFNPFDFGVNVVIEAITKYISGHSDIMMGVVLANNDDLVGSKGGLKTLAFMLALTIFSCLLEV